MGPCYRRYSDQLPGCQGAVQWQIILPCGAISLSESQGRYPSARIYAPGEYHADSAWLLPWLQADYHRDSCESCIDKQIGESAIVSFHQIADRQLFGFVL